MRYISFDVANKSLAIAIVYYKSDEEIHSSLLKEFNNYKKLKKRLLKTNPIQIFHEYNALLKKCDDILQQKFVIEYLNVVDLIPDKKLSETTTIERTYYLHKFLQQLQNTIKEITLGSRGVDDNNYKFLIEYQMGPNDKSRVVSSQIILFCMDFLSSGDSAEDRIKLVGPSLKNKLSFVNDECSYHSYYLSKYKTNYAANKNHTKYILKKIIKTYNQEHLLKDIQKKNIDDAADAVCMALAFIYKDNI
jgi:hypothetical protein